MWVKDPSALSSSLVFGATRTGNGLRLPCRKLRSTVSLPAAKPVDSYLSAAPRLRPLNHLVVSQAPGNHPGSRSPSRISDGLRLQNNRSHGCSTVGHVARECYLPDLSSTAQAPARAQFPCPSQLNRPPWPGAGKRARFQRDERRSTRLPTQKDSSQFGNVSDRTDWLALSGFVRLSYSQGAFFGRPPGVTAPGSVSREIGSSPRQMS